MSSHGNFIILSPQKKTTKLTFLTSVLPNSTSAVDTLTDGYEADDRSVLDGHLAGLD